MGWRTEAEGRYGEQEEVRDGVWLKKGDVNLPSQSLAPSGPPPLPAPQPPQPIAGHARRHAGACEPCARRCRGALRLVMRRT